MDVVMPLLVLSAPLLIIPVLVVYRRSIDAAWREAAGTLGLRYDPGGWFRRREMGGRCEGVPVQICCVSRGSGKSKTTYTRYTATIEPTLGLGLGLTSEGLLDGVSKWFGAQDIQTGDPSFDDAVMVKGRDERQVRGFLTPERRSRIRRFLTSGSYATISDGEVSFEVRGASRRAGDLVAGIQRAVEIARYLAPGHA